MKEHETADKNGDESSAAGGASAVDRINELENRLNRIERFVRVIE